jgi:hypothetical protein
MEAWFAAVSIRNWSKEAWLAAICASTRAAAFRAASAGAQGPASKKERLRGPAKGATHKRRIGPWSAPPPNN